MHLTSSALKTTMFTIIIALITFTVAEITFITHLLTERKKINQFCHLDKDKKLRGGDYISPDINCN